MSIRKKLTALCLALVFCLPVWAVNTAAADADDAFVPVLRFVAASDTHVKDDSDVTAERIGKMMALAYADAQSCDAYPGIDALLIAGDLTNDGTKTEFDKFWAAVDGALKDDTQFLGVVAKNHDGYKMNRKELRQYYTSLTGNDADFHVVIGGYHFIGVSASPNDTMHYDLKQLNWLKQQLDAAVADDPDKPVFVTHHEHVRGTVYGSSQFDGWGVPYFTSILNRYPQVVDFSGHSHFPLNDPRSVWQGKFTAIGTGAIYYAEFTIDRTRSYDPPGCTDVATCWIVELDANNRLRLRGMDVNANECLCEYVLDNPADPANREYTPAKREAAAKAPAFTEGSELEVLPTADGCIVTAPAAKSLDGMPVVLYRAFAKDSHGCTAAKTWTLPLYYTAGEVTEAELTLEGLTPGDYTVTVVAENAYGMQSEALSADLTVDGEANAASFFARIAYLFRQLIDLIKGLF
ncbi:MAG: metallophosphoesterase [Clostridia bacterium]|nr:metallophosphoesterase [Clostridia bacterium]